MSQECTCNKPDFQHAICPAHDVAASQAPAAPPELCLDAIGAPDEGLCALPKGHSGKCKWLEVYAAVPAAAPVGQLVKCKARACFSDPPADCDWPFCDCDPKANRVMEAIQESGYMLVRESSPQGWVRVEDDLPELDTLVLIATNEGGTFTGKYKQYLHTHFWLPTGNGTYPANWKVTHWQPLPAAPPSAQPGEESK